MIRSLALSLISLLFLFAGAWLHHGSPPALWGSEEKIIKMIEFPDTERYRLNESLYLDAGYKFTQYHILQIPVWNSSGEWAGYIGKPDHFLSIPRHRLQELAEDANLHIPDHINLPFWDKTGGKITLFSACLLLGFPLLMMRKKRYQ